MSNFSWVVRVIVYNNKKKIARVTLDTTDLQQAATLVSANIDAITGIKLALSSKNLDLYYQTGYMGIELGAGFTAMVEVNRAAG